MQVPCRNTDHKSLKLSTEKQAFLSEQDEIKVSNQCESRHNNKNQRNVYKLFTESINNKMTLLAIGFLFMFAQFSSSGIDLILLKW